MNRQEKIKALEDAFLSKDYSEELQHYEIEQIIGERKESIAYRGIIMDVKRRLLNDGHMIVSNRGIGYKVARPDEYTDGSVKSIMAGARRIDRGQKILQCAPVNDMNQYELQEYNDVRDRVILLSASVAVAKAEVKRLCRDRMNPLLVGVNQRQGEL